MNRPIRIAIIDDETLFSGLLARWLGMTPGLSVVGCAESGNLGWTLCLATRPDLALVDFQMTDGDGLTLARRLRDDLPGTKVIIMTGRVDPHTAWQAAQLGVQGLIDKTIKLETLTEVIRLVAQGGGFVSPAFQTIREKWLMEPEAFQKVLSDRELAVLTGVTEGHSDAAIAARLGISPETVGCHRKSIRRKLDLHDDRSLVAYGREWGIYGASKSAKPTKSKSGGAATRSSLPTPD